MKALIIYGTAHGNTEIIARAIGSAFTGDVKVASCDEVTAADMESLDYLVIGAPTYGGQPYPPMKTYLKTMGATAVNGVKVAAFDTRISTKLVGIFGYAAEKIAKRLTKLGGKLGATPEGFYVTTGKPPELQEGEAERATAWGKKLANGDG